MGGQIEKNPKKRICAGLLAHVDAGKTTLSEAMLYVGGAIRSMGRVDKGDAFLDTAALEKKRGITIFSKQAVLQWQDLSLTLLDTPGHVDFSAEMERTLQVLDLGILVVSGSEGVQSHTRTLWRLFARYRLPVILFINKMDLIGGGQEGLKERKREILRELEDSLEGNFADFSMEGETFYEAVATCGGEEELNQFLETGEVEEEAICSLIQGRQLFPCYFGSALKNEGVEELLDGVRRWVREPARLPEFGARVFKIARDPQGNRLTYMKITGGSLAVRDLAEGEKVSQLRIYSGERFEAVGKVWAGSVCAALGLSKTVPGQGLGGEQEAVSPALEPVLSCRIDLPEGVDPAWLFPQLLKLEEEEPQLRLSWSEEKKEIQAQLMGEIQMEILKNLILERFGVEVAFGEPGIVYKETIRNTVEGVGHFEPLRHYAEVHLLLEPGEPGSGLSFEADCSEDLLARNWQRLILTHLEEKKHRGILTGSLITDMRITLKSGKAHLKHTEGGDFRQAVYRAVRQGLCEADCALLEPYYEFSLEVPERFLGRAMTDIEQRNGAMLPPEIREGTACLRGSAPVSSLGGYQTEVRAYTGGEGRLSLAVKGYGPCHNEEEVIRRIGYDPDADLENPSGSVFCAHGAGFAVEWYEVKDYMHLESCLRGRGQGEAEPGQGEAGQEGPGAGNQESGAAEGAALSGKALARRQAAQEKKREGRASEIWLGTEEIDAILSQASHANSRGKDRSSNSRWGVGRQRERGPEQVRVFGQETGAGQPSGSGRLGNAGQRKSSAQSGRQEYLLVDGYNVIFAWQELKDLAAVNIDSARDRLLDILSNYQGIRRCRIIAVFDAYRVQGHREESFSWHNIQVVFTREAETADQYIEKFAYEKGRSCSVTVATSDRLEQIIIRGQGCRLLSARELEEEISRAVKELREQYENLPQKGVQRLGDAFSEEVAKAVRELGEE